MAKAEMGGFDEVMKNLNREIRKIHDRTKAGMNAVVLNLKAKAQRVTPVGVTGNLINSCGTEVWEGPVAGIVGTIYYTAEYAPKVHEMVGANFRKPGATAKFLENPVMESQAEIVETLRKWAHVK